MEYAVRISADPATVAVVQRITADLIAERDLLRAQVETAREEATRFRQFGMGSASDYDKGGQRAAEAVLLLLRSPDDYMED